MSFIIDYIASLASWIYGLCGLIALYYLYQVRVIRRERLQAIFALERERAARSMVHVLTRVTGLILLMSATYFISNVMARAVEMEQDANGSVPVVAAVPDNAGGLATPTPLSAVGEEEAVAVEGVLELYSVPACEDENATILTPGVQQEITGAVVMTGIATHDDFAAYYIEIAPGATPQDNDFTLLGQGSNQVRGGHLLDFDTSPHISGVYSLRLRVMDLNGEFVGSCQVEVRIVAG